MPTIALVDGASTTYPNNGTALGAGNTFDITANFVNTLITDDDATFDGDQAVNETPDDLNQTVDVGGTQVPIGYDYAFQASAGGITYTFAVIDVDLNNDGDFGSGTIGGVDPGENRVYIAVLGPSTPVIPPGGTTFTVTTTVSDNTDQPFTNFICFAAGTGIRGPDGFAAIETLKVGDMVWTERGTFEPIRWAGERLVVATGAKAPISIEGRGFGAGRSLVLSPQHRVLLRGGALEVVTGKREGLAKMHDLSQHALAHQGRGGLVSYHHILLDRHAMVQTHAGHWAETLFPGVEALKTLDPGAFEEVAEVFPQLRTERGTDWKLSRPLLDAREISAFARYISHNDGVGHVSDLP